MRHSTTLDCCAILLFAAMAAFGATDAGARDASAGNDGGAVDAGTHDAAMPVDAALPSHDASSAKDGGASSSSNADDTSGCSCDAPGVASVSGAGWLFALGALGARLRRRR